MSQLTHLLTQTCIVKRKTTTRDANRNSIDKWKIVASNVPCATFSHALYRQRMTQFVSKLAPNDIIRIAIFEFDQDIKAGDRILLDDNSTYHVQGPPQVVWNPRKKKHSHMEAPLSIEPL
jgi:hypothetical protein